MWTAFRMNGHELEWQVTGESLRFLHIRSRDGRFLMRANILDDVYARDHGRIVLSLVAKPLILGEEFPPGRSASELPFRFSGLGFELAKGGIIHTELVRSLIGRWVHRRRHRSKLEQPASLEGATGNSQG